MSFDDIYSKKWIFSGVIIIALWLSTTKLENYQFYQAWKNRIEATFNNRPIEFQRKYNALLKAYKNRPMSSMRLNGAYSYKNRYMALIVTFDGHKITVDRKKLHRGHNVASATFEIVGSTMIFRDIEPSGSNWLYLGSSYEALEAIPNREQAFEVISENEIRWFDIDNQYWQLIKQ